MGFPLLVKEGNFQRRGAPSRIVSEDLIHLQQVLNLKTSNSRRQISPRPSVRSEARCIRMVGKPSPSLCQDGADLIVAEVLEVARAHAEAARLEETALAPRGFDAEIDGAHLQAERRLRGDDERGLICRVPHLLLSSRQEAVRHVVHLGALQPERVGGVERREQVGRDLRESRHEELLVPRLSEVTPHLLAALDAADALGLQGAEVYYVPYCFLPGREQQVWHPADEAALVVTPQSTFRLEMGAIDLGVKTARCQGCLFEPRCFGVRPSYLEHFGDDEIRPVLAQ